MKTLRALLAATILLLLGTMASFLTSCAGQNLSAQDIEDASRQATGISEAINAYVRATTPPVIPAK